MATAVSAGAATAGVRGGVGMCSCAVTMATAFVQCWSCNSWGQRWRRAVLLCSHHGNNCHAVLELQQLGSEMAQGCTLVHAASVTTLVTVAVAKSESWNTYMINYYRPAFMKPLTVF